MVWIVTVPCHCLFFNFTQSYLGPFLFWSIKALGEFKEEHNIVCVYGGGGVY